MNRDVSRRTVLQTAAATGSLIAFGSATVAGDQPSVRVIEAGITYEVPERDDYDRVHLDSRPGYAIDGRSNELHLAAGSRLASRSFLADGTTLVDERAAEDELLGSDDGFEIRESGNRVSLLPTATSARQRVQAAIGLAESHLLPTITVDFEGTSPAVTVGSLERIELPAGSTHEHSLDAEAVTVRTRAETDELATLDSAPDWQASVRRETGSATVSAVPTVELVNHGHLAVRTARFARRS